MSDQTDSTERSDDRDLVARISRFDDAAFAEAYDRHSTLVFGSVVRFLGDREAAAEVTQDAFLALWRRAGQFDASAGSLSAWLLGIARHRAIDRFRSEGRRVSSRSIPLSAVVEDADAPGSASDDELPTWRMSGDDGAVHDPALIADRHWLQAVVRTVVSDLPEVERSVVLLAYSGGLSQSEIADRIGAPIGTVKSRTRRAFARLRDALAAVPGLLDDDALTLAPLLADDEAAR